MGTINSDLQALEEEWEESALEERGKKKARVAAELRELKRAAYGDRDYKLVAEIIKQERQLYSLDDPIELNVMGRVEHTHTVERETAVDEMEEPELDQLIANLLVVVDAQANWPESDRLIEGTVVDVDGT